MRELPYNNIGSSSVANKRFIISSFSSVCVSSILRSLEQQKAPVFTGAFVFDRKASNEIVTD